MNFMALIFSIVLAAQSADVGKVDSKFDEHVDFGAFRTYSWTPGFDAYDRDAHRMIVAAMEAEMGRLGFSKVTTAADVTLAYYTLTYTEVDLDALDELEDLAEHEREMQIVTPTKTVGKLVVVMRRPTSIREIWVASTRDYVDPDPLHRDATIRKVASRLFETYPAQKPPRRNQ